MEGRFPLKMKKDKATTIRNLHEPTKGYDGTESRSAEGTNIPLQKGNE